MTNSNKNALVKRIIPCNQEKPISQAAPDTLIQGEGGRREKANPSPFHRKKPQKHPFQIQTYTKTSSTEHKNTPPKRRYQVTWNTCPSPKFFFPDITSNRTQAPTIKPLTLYPVSIRIVVREAHGVSFYQVSTRREYSF